MFWGLVPVSHTQAIVNQAAALELPVFNVFVALNLRPIYLVSII